MPKKTVHSTLEIPLTDDEILNAPKNNYVSVVLIALLVGIGAGLGAVVFRWLILHCTLFFSGSTDPSALGHTAHRYVQWLGPFFVLFTPIIAGLIYGPLVAKFAPEAKGHGVPEVMLAVAERGGKIPPQVSLVKALASALCIGSGGSVGREGPIVQIGSALGSSLAQVLRLDRQYVRLLVACGAAGGVAATFSAPFSGVIFASELILREFAPLSFAVTSLASLTAFLTNYLIEGNKPFITLPLYSLEHWQGYVLIIFLGALVGVLGFIFSRFLYFVEDICEKLWKGPQWLMPGAMGIMVGCVLLILPEMYGVGYPVLTGAIQGRYAVWFLVVLLCGKMLATSLTIGVGGSGGVFAPTLFIGAMAGSALGQVVHMVSPSLVPHPGIWGVIGMAAAFSGATLAPVTGIVIITELTREINLFLPLILAVAVATIISRTISQDTIYTLKLRRRGININY